MANTARARDAGRGAQKEVRPLASTLPLRENGRRDLFLQTITRCPSRDDEDNTMEGVTFAGQCRRGTPTLLPLFVAARLLHVFRVELSRSRRPESVLLAGRRDGLACTALLVSCVLVLFAARLRANQLSYGVLLGCVELPSIVDIYRRRRVLPWSIALLNILATITPHNTKRHMTMNTLFPPNPF